MSIFKGKPWLLQVIAAVLIAVLSITILGNIAGSVDTHGATIAELDSEKSTVTQLLASSTAASAVITLIPDDVGTPIADKLAGLSSFFIFILSVLYAEKYLLTLIGVCVFKLLIPTACGFYIWNCIRPGRMPVNKFLQKLVIVGLVIFHLIPLSAYVSKSIETTYQESINATITAAISSDESDSAAETEDKGWFQNLIDGVVSSTTGAIEWAKTVLNHFIEATAIMLVTTCLIPFLVFIIVLSLLKKAFSLELPALPVHTNPSREEKKE